VIDTQIPARKLRAASVAGLVHSTEIFALFFFFEAEVALCHMLAVAVFFLFGALISKNKYVLLCRFESSRNSTD